MGKDSIKCKVPGLKNYPFLWDICITKLLFPLILFFLLKFNIIFLLSLLDNSQQEWLHD